MPNVLPQTPPYIDRVHSESPAEKAKLQPDDLVVYVDGEPIYSIQTFKDIDHETTRRVQRSSSKFAAARS